MSNAVTHPDPPDEMSDAWVNEINRRVADVEAGRLSVLPIEQLLPGFAKRSEYAAARAAEIDRRSAEHVAGWRHGIPAEVRFPELADGE